MSTLSPQKQTLVNMIICMPEENVPTLLDYMLDSQLCYDENEPPLTPEEIECLKESEEDIKAGRLIPFDEVMKELW